MAKRELLFVLTLALIPRAILAAWQVLHGIQWYPGLETFADFYYYYIWQVNHLSVGLLPYRDFAYLYPPLFIYTIYAFSLPNLAGLPIVLSDAATSAAVYLIVKKNAGERIGMIAGLIYALCPFFLLYEGYAWLSEQPMFFFMLLAMYLLQGGRVKASALSFAVSLLYKQEALFVAPAYLLWTLIRFGRRSPLVFAGIAALFFLAVSLPFLAVTPLNYFAQLTLGKIIPIGPIPFPRGLPGGATHATSRPALAAALVTFFALSLLLTRREKSFPQLGAAITMGAFTTSLMSLGHLFGLRYYLVPFYGLAVASVTDIPSAAIALIVPSASLLLPTGTVQVLLPAGEIFLMMSYMLVANRRNLKELLPRLQAASQRGEPIHDGS